MLVKRGRASGLFELGLVPLVVDIGRVPSCRWKEFPQNLDCGALASPFRRDEFIFASVSSGPVLSYPSHLGLYLDADGVPVTDKELGVVQVEPLEVQDPGLESDAIGAARIARLVEERLGTGWVILEYLPDICRPLIELDRDGSIEAADLPLGDGICKAFIESLVDLLEVEGHLQRLAHPDIAKGLHLGVRGDRIVRP